jgi:hypothetical protein
MPAIPEAAVAVAASRNGDVTGPAACEDGFGVGEDGFDGPSGLTDTAGTDSVNTVPSRLETFGVPVSSRTIVACRLVLSTTNEFPIAVLPFTDRNRPAALS